VNGKGRKPEAARALVTIPAYNEGRRIAQVVAAVRSLGTGHDILVIDDGSRDDTADAAASSGATVISHAINMGYGVTIQTGYKYAREKDYDFLVQIDGDGQHDPAFIPQLLGPVMNGEADVAVGSRFREAGSYRPSVSRRLGILFFRKLVSGIIGQEITDPTSGYQAMNREVIRHFTSDVFPCDYPDADVLLSLNRAGFRIKEVPVRMFANAEGKTMHSGMKPIYYMFKMCLSIFVTLLRNPALYRR
jgi:glycosyltransferase involved in cell wall biosynthesis